MSGPFLTSADHDTLRKEQDDALTARLQELTLAAEREEEELGLESPRAFQDMEGMGGNLPEEALVVAQVEALVAVAPEEEVEPAVVPVVAAVVDMAEVREQEFPFPCRPLALLLPSVAQTRTKFWRLHSNHSNDKSTPLVTSPDCPSFLRSPFMTLSGTKFLRSLCFVPIVDELLHAAETIITVRWRTWIDSDFGINDNHLVTFRKMMFHQR